MALIMVMGLSLLVYALAERKIRTVAHIPDPFLQKIDFFIRWAETR
jgi:hypothetical protein